MEDSKKEDSLRDIDRDVADRLNKKIASKPGGTSFLSADNELTEEVINTYEKIIKLEQKNIRDPLTGAYNRRYLEAVIESRKADKNPHPLAIMMIDLDDFKLKNDTYGHPTGDKILQRTAENLLINTQSKDMVIRYGGEEFLVILDNLDNLGVIQERADEFRSKIENMKITPADKNDETVIKQTVSIGVSMCGINDELEKIIEKADKGLYSAKASGKNRVVVL
jgi:two-component system cell cycle response regulator